MANPFGFGRCFVVRVPWYSIQHFSVLSTAWTWPNVNMFRTSISVDIRSLLGQRSTSWERFRLLCQDHFDTFRPYDNGRWQKYRGETSRCGRSGFRSSHSYDGRVWRADKEILEHFHSFPFLLQPQVYSQHWHHLYRLWVKGNTHTWPTCLLWGTTEMRYWTSEED